MASGPITSWQIDVETVETVTDYIFLGSKITADGGCSHEIKRHLLLVKKAMTNLDSVFKSRDILPTKVHIFKAVVLPIVMYQCEWWTIKKAEHETIKSKILFRVPGHSIQSAPRMSPPYPFPAPTPHLPWTNNSNPSSNCNLL